MRKKLNEILNNTLPSEVESLSTYIDDGSLSKETLSSIKKKVNQKTGVNRHKSKRLLARRLRYLAAAAACVVIIIAALIIAPMIKEKNKDGNDRSYAPIVNIQAASSAPHYYGSESSIGSSELGMVVDHPPGLSVTARLIETLPDTYTFYDDWQQNEFRLLRLETVKLLAGSEMTQEFYYLIPVAFMTDFSEFDTFVIMDMAQFFCEHSVMYNRTRGVAERLTLVLFGYRPYNYTSLGSRFIAYDADGIFDSRLWEANEAWIAATARASAADTLKKAEADAKEQASHYADVYTERVYLLNGASGEAASILSQLKSFDNGIFVISNNRFGLGWLPPDHIHAVRYIDGFATNERITLKSKSVTGSDQIRYEISKSKFDENDLNTLPDLTSAFEYVADAYNNGEILPPHVIGHESLQLKSYGIFGWYAKTADGVVGVVRVNWHYISGKRDDAYYIIEYGSEKCVSISRDDLLDRLGEYEATYIYTGCYNENGKDEILPYF